MNFMSGRPGFYEEITTAATTRGMSSASSPSSSSSSAFPSYPAASYHQQDAAAAAAAAAANYQMFPPPPESSLSHTNNGGGGDDETEDVHTLALRQRGDGSSAAVVIEREHMFDKVVTPSDVGKLNRLVIPKQHAEKYFPLDSSTNEKGLLLNFEDRNGKPWRFRYSYWNSSQSYVMTKGWSRFVKEKKLDAGDIVSFQRGVGELGKDRLFIDWRRRPDAPELIPPSIPSFSFPHQFSWNHPLFPPPSRDYSLLQAHHHFHPHHHHQNHTPYGYTNVVNGNPCPPGSIVYLRSGAPIQLGGGGSSGILSPQLQQVMGLGGGGGQMMRGNIGTSAGGGGAGMEGMQVFESVPVVQGKAAAKRLRLFGVNMDCPISESDECDILPTTTTNFPNSTMQPPPLGHQTYYQLLDNSSSNNDLFQTRPNYGGSGSSGGGRNYNNEDKGKGSMSLELDI